ncbi:Sulfate adenylyltransferase [Symbiodinium microadriaticum]|uniref:Sulfate adenylyltransferase n=1 Tax=Symbiodinium microadriaticum TaxID=2951 RepID=A0A1Q9F1Q8_SYMMI|nr:Sulfate adenylyltransferase [Symbiodinium microadriaticum]
MRSACRKRRKMERPELLRRGYYNEVNEDAWPGPFEDVFIYIICQEAAELPKVRNYIEKADAVATRQGRVLRHVIFNLNLNKLRGDIEFYNKLLPFQPGQATPKVHLDFFSTFRNSYLIRFGKYTQTVLRDPFNINYVGAMYHAYPSPWQVFMQDPDGNYQPIHATDLRPSIQCVKRKLQRANGLWRDVGLPEDENEDDVYKVVDMKAAGTINKTVLQFIKEGAGDALWWEEEFEDEVSRKWLQADLDLATTFWRSRFSGRLSSSVAPKVDDFCKHVELHLPKDGKKVVFATAWLATDNVFVAGYLENALMRKHFPEVLNGMNLVAIDTLHLFPTTLECAKLVEEKYAKQDEFIAKYGDCEELDSADFDFVSKAKSPSIQCVKRKLQRANGLWRDVGLPEDENEDDVYKVVDMKAAGTINKTVLQFIKEGAGDALWWEEEFEDEVSRKWLQADLDLATTFWRSRFSGRLSSSVAPKVDDFCKHVELHLPKDGKKVVFATAWLATDNVFVAGYLENALMRKHFPEVLNGMNLVAIDTLHLFPTTLECAKLVEEKYAKQDEFIAKYGDCEELDSADFDFVSKAKSAVEPFQRALEECEKDILITGRRMDQAAQRIKLDVWEDQKRTLNPMANFSWQDIIDYVDKEGVPVNGPSLRALKRLVIVVMSGPVSILKLSTAFQATSRHLPDLPWTKANTSEVDLGKPFWRCTEAPLEVSAITYVFKSFGLALSDMHTTVPAAFAMFAGRGKSPGEDRVRQQPQKGKVSIHTRTTFAGAPHGGSLVDLMVKDPADIKSLTASAVKTIELNERQEESAYNSVVKDMRLPEKQLFGLPVTFDLPEVDGINKGDKLLLLKWKGQDVAVLEASSIWKPNKVVEAKECYGTSSLEHPTVASLVQEIGKYYIGGRMHGFELPKFGYTTQTPAEVRATLPENKQVVAFQNRNPIHRAHFELLVCAQKDVKDSILLVHPTCGPTQPGDIDGLVRIQTYEALKTETEKEYPMFRWAYLPYSMKMAGPREAIQHMIIRKNYGATHFIIGRDMAGTKSTIDGEDFYGAYDAQETGKKYSAELGVTVTHYENMVYVGPEEGYVQD